jgi:hypothetical protein
MSLFNILNSNNYGTYNRHVARKIGLHATVLLSEVLDKYEHFQINKTTVALPDEEGVWFYLTAETIEERTTLSEKEQRPCIEKLIKFGFIKKKVSGLPAKRYFQVNEQRLIEFILNEINFTSLDKRPDWIGQKGKTGLDKRPNSPIYKNPNNEPKEDKETEAKAPEPPPSTSSPPSKRKKAPEQKTEVASRVFLTPSQVDALKKRLETSKIDSQAIYDELSTWKISKEIWGGSDYSSIINWVIDAVTKKTNDRTVQDKSMHLPLPNSAPNKTEQTFKDNLWAQKVEKKFFTLTKVQLLTITSHYIEFNLGNRGGDVKVYFGSAGFREVCLKYLRQLNQDTTGL